MGKDNDVYYVESVFRIIRHREDSPRQKVKFIKLPLSIAERKSDLIKQIDTRMVEIAEEFPNGLGALSESGESYLNIYDKPVSSDGGDTLEELREKYLSAQPSKDYETAEIYRTFKGTPHSRGDILNLREMISNTEKSSETEQ